jgi:methionyl-tRNA formyltransferase
VTSHPEAKREEGLNIALFASDEVGYEIARFLNDNNEPTACLVLDSKDTKGFNEKILHNSSSGEVFYSDELYDKKNLEKLESLGIDIAILAWWPYIVKEPLMKLSRMGYLNFHPSLLPFNRGKHPNFWSIVENAPYGVSLHFIDEGVDTGPVAFQKAIEVSWEDTGEKLYEKGKREIVNLFKENFNDIRIGNIPRLPQDYNQGSFHMAKEIDEASHISLDAEYTARKLLNILRARTFPPYPSAWFTDAGQKYEVRVEIKKIET